MAEKEKNVMNVLQLLKEKELDKEPVPIALNANLIFKPFLQSFLDDRVNK